MSSKKMIQGVVLSKLDQFQNCLSRMESKKPLKVLDATTSESLRKAVGLRNVLVHEYDGVNWQIVYDVVYLHLQCFKDFAKQVSEKYLKA